MSIEISYTTLWASTIIQNRNRLCIYKFAKCNMPSICTFPCSTKVPPQAEFKRGILCLTFLKRLFLWEFLVVVGFVWLFFYVLFWVFSGGGGGGCCFAGFFLIVNTTCAFWRQNKEL